MKFCTFLVGFLCIIGLVVSQTTQQCPKPCNRAYRPVCALQTDGSGGTEYRRFPNRCAMDNQNECHDGNWSLTDSSLCNSTTEE
nr:vasotab-like [Halyomorpha halys]